MKHKKLFISLTAIFSLVMVLFIFITIWFWGDDYDDFDNNFREEFTIPELKNNAVPQGIASRKARYKVKVTAEDGTEKEEEKSQEYFLISAYRKNAPSRLYVIGKQTGYGGYVTMKTEDGQDFFGHCGGVATNGMFVWISSDSKVFCFKSNSSDYIDALDEVIKKAALNLNPQEGAEEQYITFTYSFDANCNASFLYYYDYDNNDDYSISGSDRLYVGEFYRKGNYETDKKHHIEIKNSKKEVVTTNRAFAYEYYVDTSSQAENFTGLRRLDKSYLSSDAPQVPQVQRIYSIPDEIQGFARTSDGRLILSQSYGLKNSHLYYYNFSNSDLSSGGYAMIDSTSNSSSYYDLKGEYFAYNGIKTKDGADATSFNTGNSSLRVYNIYNEKVNEKPLLVRDYSIPSMSEGLCVSGNRVCVLFESGSYKYKTFVRQQLTEVYSFIPRKK